MEMATKDFRKLIKIDRNKINDEMAQHPEHLYEIGAKIEKLWEKLTEAEETLKDQEATIASGTRNKYKRSKIDLTETALRDIVRADKSLPPLREEVKKWQRLYRIAKMKKDVLKTKGEMMVNISHNVREEKKRS
jgi:hypothetical protein